MITNIQLNVRIPSVVYTFGTDNSLRKVSRRPGGQGVKKICFSEPLFDFFQRKIKSLALRLKTPSETELFSLPRHSKKHIFLASEAESQATISSFRKCSRETSDYTCEDPVSPNRDYSKPQKLCCEQTGSAKIYPHFVRRFSGPGKLTASFRANYLLHLNNLNVNNAGNSYKLDR
jgi:hypothetical protein